MKLESSLRGLWQVNLPYIVSCDKSVKRVDAGISDYLSDLSESRTLDELWSVCLNYFQKMGLESVNYLYLRPNTSPENFVSLTNLPDWWTDYYLSPDRMSENPIIHTCRNYEMNLICREFLHLHPYLNKREVQFINEHSETGIISGFTVPVALVQDGWFGCWQFGSNMTAEKFEPFFETVKSKAQIMGLYAHLRIQALRSQTLVSPCSSGSGEKSILSEREKICLYHLAKGKRIAQIADQLRVKPVTVDFHLKNARRKLGAATREEAIARAITTKQITLDFQ